MTENFLIFFSVSSVPLGTAVKFKREIFNNLFQTEFKGFINFISFSISKLAAFKMIHLKILIIPANLRISK